MANIFTKVDVRPPKSCKRYVVPKVVTEDVESDNQKITYERIDLVTSQDFNESVSTDFNKYTLTEKLRAGVQLKETSSVIPSGHESLIENDAEIQRGINDLAENEVDVKQFSNSND